jgi:integrase/recombinase XerD
MKLTDFATHVTAFLTSYLPAQRNASPNTIEAYRDAFVLLLRYCRDVRGLAPERLALKQIDPPLVLGFLDHLEKDRRCSARTRNLRLTALHSFFRYLQAEEPSFLLPCQREGRPKTASPWWAREATRGCTIAPPTQAVAGRDHI